MNLNHLAISLIELDPENISDLDVFKKSLVLAKKKARGKVKDILGHACARARGMVGHDLESRRAGIVRLGELLEQAMEFSAENSSGAKPKIPPAVLPEKMKSLKFTLSDEFDADLLNEFIVESMECSNMAESASWTGKRIRTTRNY